MKISRHYQRDLRIGNNFGEKIESKQSLYKIVKETVPYIIKPMSSLTTENNCINIFRKRIKEKTLEVQEEFEKIKGDPALIKIFKKKYPN